MALFPDAYMHHSALVSLTETTISWLPTYDDKLAHNHMVLDIKRWMANYLEKNDKEVFFFLF